MRVVAHDATVVTVRMQMRKLALALPAFDGDEGDCDSRNGQRDKHNFEFLAFSEQSCDQTCVPNLVVLLKFAVFASRWAMRSGF